MDIYTKIEASSHEKRIIEVIIYQKLKSGLGIKFYFYLKLKLFRRQDINQLICRMLYLFLVLLMPTVLSQSTFLNQGASLITSSTGAGTNTFPLTFSPAFTNAPQIAICISALQFANPMTELKFKLEITSALAASGSIQYTIQSTTIISLIKVYYFAFDRIIFEIGGNYMFHTFHHTNDWSGSALQTPIGTVRSQKVTTATQANHKFQNMPKLFYFLVGVSLVTSGPMSKADVKIDTEFRQISNTRGYDYRVTVSEETSLLSTSVCVFEINDWFASFDFDLIVTANQFIQEGAVTTGTVPVIGNSQQYLFGLNSISILMDGTNAGDSTPYSFDFTGTLATSTTLGDSFGFNRFLQFGLEVVAACATGQIRDYKTGTCSTTRLGCSNIIQQLTSDTTTYYDGIIHESNRYLLLRSYQEILFFEYNDNAGQFINYFTLQNSYDGQFSSIDITKDFSRFVIAGQSTLKAYMWNGTSYVQGFYFNTKDFETSSSYYIYEPQISADGKIIIAYGDTFASRPHTFIFQFNDNLGNYQLKNDLPISPRKLKITESLDLLIHKTQELFVMTETLVVKQKVTLQTANSVNPARHSFSGNGKVLGYVFLDFDYALNDDQGIYIYQLNETTQQYELFQKFKPRFSLYEYQLSMNYDGTVLVVLINDYSIMMTVVYRRNSLNDLFEEAEVLGSYQPYNYEHSVRTPSPDGQMILTSDVVIKLFYCTSMISQYTLPAKTSMYTSTSTSTESVNVVAESTASQESNGAMQAVTLAFVIIGVILLVVNLLFAIFKTQTPPRTFDNQYETEKNDNFKPKQSEGLQAVNEESPTKNNSRNNLNEDSPVLRKRKRKREKQFAINQNESINVEQIDE